MRRNTFPDLDLSNRARRIPMTPKAPPPAKSARILFGGIGFVKASPNVDRMPL